jgi:hypothetical protein
VWSLNNVRKYEIHEAERTISDSPSADPIGSNSFAEIAIERVCISSFHSFLNYAETVVVGAKIKGLRRGSDPTKSEFDVVYRSTNNFGGGCLNFSEFSLGYYRLTVDPVSILLTANVLRNEEQEAFASAVLDIGSTAAKLGGIPVADSVNEKIYKLVINRPDYYMLNFSLSLPVVAPPNQWSVRNARIVLIGEMDTSWPDKVKAYPFTFWSEREPEFIPSEAKHLRVNPEGELFKNELPYKGHSYLVLRITKLPRNLTLEPDVQRLLGSVIDDALRLSTNPKTAIKSIEEFSSFYRANNKNGNFSAVESEFLSETDRCLTSWASIVASESNVYQVASLSEKQRSALVSNLGRLSLDCENFHAKAVAFRDSCADGFSHSSDFEPYCAERRLSQMLQTNFKHLVAETQKHHELVANFTELSAKYAVLEAANKSSTSKYSSVLNTLKEGGFDTENLSESMNLYRRNQEAFDAASRQLADLNVGGRAKGTT